MSSTQWGLLFAVLAACFWKLCFIQRELARTNSVLSLVKNHLSNIAVEAGVSKDLLADLVYGPRIEDDDGS